MIEKLKGHTEGPLEVINHCGGYWLLAPYHFCKPTAENIKNIADAELYAAAPELLAEVLRLRARVAELDKSFKGMNWQRMHLAPMDGTAFLAMMEGSDCPVTIRRVGKKWVTPFDQYELSEADGPRCWMPIPSSAL